MGRAFEFRKERKFKRWAKMAKAFSRISKDVIIAIREGGPDPEANAKLRAVYQNAKSLNVPKDVIDRAIKKATDKDTQDFVESIFEGYGAHGVAVIIDTATDNNQRTVANIRSYFNKCNGSLGKSGSVSFMFDHQCNFTIDKGELDEEELELELIDYGAEEIFVEDDKIIVYASFDSYGALQAYFETAGIEIVESGFEWTPNVTKDLTADQVQDIDKLIDKIEEDDDVQQVFHNMIRPEGSEPEGD